jgi:endo-1,3-1,4-beta-glycanase
MNMPRFAVAFLCSICAVDRIAPAPAAVFSIALIRHNKELFMDIRRFLLAAILFSATLFAAPHPKPPVSGAWRLVLAEEFNGTNLNPKVWMKLRGLGPG